VLEGGQVLFNLNNLATFGETPAAVQHQRLATFRAIENRRWLVRCGTTGSTAVITATGRVQNQAPLREPAVLVVSVPLLQRQTLYTRLSDSFAMGCAIIAVLWCFLRNGIAAKGAVARRELTARPSSNSPRD
jgi:apolipoprotein N-acyltransferase